jgi:3-hydroxyisobutyrate dehydrogenase
VDSESRGVGVIGLGEIGGPVARLLLQAGWDVWGHDVDPGAVAAISGLSDGGSPQGVGEASETVFIAVYDDEQLREVLTGPAGLLSAGRPPGTVCVLSTITLETLSWAARTAADREVALIDCGVTGGKGLREGGKIVVFAGGSSDVVTRVTPVMDAFADPLFHMGPLGAGMKAKLARNLMHYSGWYASWEAACIAATSGLDLDKLIDGYNISVQRSGGGGGTSLLLQGIRPDGPVDEEDPADVRRRERAAAFARKDLTYILELGEEIGVPLPGASLVRDRIDLVVGLAEEPGGRTGPKS